MSHLAMSNATMNSFHGAAFTMLQNTLPIFQTVVPRELLIAVLAVLSVSIIVCVDDPNQKKFVFKVMFLACGTMSTIRTGLMFGSVAGGNMAFDWAALAVLGHSVESMLDIWRRININDFAPIDRRAHHAKTQSSQRRERMRKYYDSNMKRIEDVECVVCWCEMSESTVFFPCLHTCCTACSSHYPIGEHCPMCRTVIEGRRDVLGKPFEVSFPLDSATSASWIVNWGAGDAIGDPSSREEEEKDQPAVRQENLPEIFAAGLRPVMARKTTKSSIRRQFDLDLVAQSLPPETLDRVFYSKLSTNSPIFPYPLRLADRGAQMGA